MRGSYSVKHPIVRDVNVREEIWRGYACARTGAPQSFHVRGLNDNPNTQIGRVLQLASTAIPFPHLLLGLRVCPLGELKIPTHMTNLVLAEPASNFSGLRYNRFGYPVFPQKAFGLPSPSGPVSFAGFSSPASQVRIRIVIVR